MAGRSWWSRRRHVFAKNSSLPPLDRFDSTAAARVSRTRGDVLITEFWGSYVALIAGPDGQDFTVLRDPSGALPCYTLRHGEVTFISSDIETLDATGQVSLAIDWCNLAGHLRLLDRRTPASCLTGLTEVLAGQRIDVFRPNLPADMRWSPWAFASNPNCGPTTAIIEGLEATIDSTVHAWARSFEHILLAISGGLDSSILAAALKMSGVKTTLLTMATDELGGDERLYARAVAEALDLPMVEAFHNLEGIDVARATSSHLPRPLFSAFGQSEHETKFALSRDLGIDAFFTGIGGDNVFCYVQSAAPVVDRFRIDGWSAGIFQTASDVCTLTGATVPQVVGHAVKRQFAGVHYRWAAETDLLSKDTWAISPEKVLHPWLVAPKDALPGKYVHVGMLARIQGTIDGFSRWVAPQINPLLSQPIVEACLRIPTWQWIEAGRNRAMARLAFKGRLPSMIIDRRSKGGPESFACQVVDSNRETLKALLLDGLLAQNGVIDTKAVATCLSDPAPISIERQKRLALLAEAEAWARVWHDPKARRYPPSGRYEGSPASGANADIAPPFPGQDLPAASART